MIRRSIASLLIAFATWIAHGSAAAASALSESFTSASFMVVAPFFYWTDDETGGHLRRPDGTWNVTLFPPDIAPGYRAPGTTWRSKQWHKTQLIDMKAAGIDICAAVSFSLEPDESWTHQGFRNLLDAALELQNEGRNPPKIALFIDTSSLPFRVETITRGTSFTTDLTQPVWRDVFVSMVRRAWAPVADAPLPPEGKTTPTLNRRLDQSKYWPVIARMEGAPMMLWYEAGRGYFFSDWDHSLFDAVQSTFEQDFGVRPAVFPDYEWWMKNPHERQRPYDLHYGGYVRWRASLYEPFAPTEPLQWPMKGPDAVQIGPGMDDRLHPGRLTNGTPIRSRDLGAFYAYSWQYAHRTNRRMVVVESWNELLEGMGVCESWQYGRAYLRETARQSAIHREDFLGAPCVWTRLFGQNTDGLAVTNDEHGLYQVDGAVPRSVEQPFGLRETDFLTDPTPPTPGKTISTYIGGSACRRTNEPTYPQMLFDVNDRFLLPIQKKSPLHLSLEYFDRGTDSFQVIAGDQEPVAPPIKKTNSQSWKVASFQVSRSVFAGRLGAAINHMVHEKIPCDFAIDSMNDGDEWIRGVSLSVAPTAGVPPWPAAVATGPAEGITSSTSFSIQAPAWTEFRSATTVTISALANGVPATTYTGRLRLRTRGTAGGVPPVFSLLPSDRGTTTLQVSFLRAGNEALDVVDADDPAARGHAEIFVPPPPCFVDGPTTSGLRALVPVTLNHDPASSTSVSNRNINRTLYPFDIEDRVYSRLGTYPYSYPIYIHVDYVDEGSAPFRLLYDSTDEFAAPIGCKPLRTQVHRRTGTNQIRRAVFAMDDALFSNRSMGGDWAVDDMGTPLAIVRAYVGVTPDSESTLPWTVARSQQVGDQVSMKMDYVAMAPFPTPSPRRLEVLSRDGSVRRSIMLSPTTPLEIRLPKSSVQDCVLYEAGRPARSILLRDLETRPRTMGP